MAASDRVCIISPFGDAVVRPYGGSLLGAQEAKDMKLLLGVAALFLCTGIPAIAAQIGIAYDEVSELYTARPIPLPTDFARVYGDVNNTAHAQNRRIFHMAFLGNLRRTEAMDGTVVLDRPDLGKYLILDPAKKTYWTEPFVPRETYSVGNSPPMPSPDAPRVAAVVEGVHDNWPQQTVDGWTVAGMSARIFIEVPGGGGCKLAPNSRELDDVHDKRSARTGTQRR
jgi:hypothetical protein